MASAFKPTEAVTFDLDFGHIHLDGAPTRVMVPANELVALCAVAGPEPTARMGRAMGEALGRRVAKRLGGSDAGARRAALGACDYADVFNELSMEMALIGVGSLSTERWGSAIILVVDQSPLGVDGDGLLAALIAAALDTMTGEAVHPVKLERDGVRARFLLLEDKAAGEVEARLARGASWGAILAALHAGGRR